MSVGLIDFASRQNQFSPLRDQGLTCERGLSQDALAHECGIYRTYLVELVTKNSEYSEASRMRPRPTPSSPVVH